MTQEKPLDIDITNMTDIELFQLTQDIDKRIAYLDHRCNYIKATKFMVVIGFALLFPMFLIEGEIQTYYQYGFYAFHAYIWYRFFYLKWFMKDENGER